MKKFWMLAFLCGAGSEKAIEQGQPTSQSGVWKAVPHFDIKNEIQGQLPVPAYTPEGPSYTCVPDREVERRHLVAIWLLLEAHNNLQHSNDWLFDPNITKEEEKHSGIDHFTFLKSKNDRDTAMMMAKAAQEVAASLGKTAK